jgi:tetratricopeptide (TPR) repeat protein
LRALAGAVVVAVLIGAAARLQAVREGHYPEPPATSESLYLTSGTTARRLSVGYSMLGADLYWIRAIQYYGGTRLRLDSAAQDRRGRSEDRLLPGAGASADTRDFELLYPLLDLTTTLDPRFNLAYRFGAIFLAEPSPGGAGRPDLAIALLEKGLRERPDKWEYMQDIGFVNYWWRRDYQEAAKWFDKASQVPDAPWFLRSLAAVTLAEGGDRKSSRTMWMAIRQSAEIDWLRSDADRRLQQLDTMDLIDAVQRAVDAAAPRTGKLTKWPDLIRAGVLRGVPVDPAGVPLGIDDEAQVHLAVMSPLYPLPLEAQSGPASHQQ